MHDQTLHPRTERLRALMSTFDVTDEDVAELLGRRPITVAIWRCASDTRVIPEHTLLVLELRLERRAREQAA